MKELIDYKDARIDALTKRLAQLERANDTLASWLYEVTDRDCTNEYRQIIRSEIKTQTQ